MQKVLCMDFRFDKIHKNLTNENKKKEKHYRVLRSPACRGGRELCTKLSGTDNL